MPDQTRLVLGSFCLGVQASELQAEHVAAFEIGSHDVLVLLAEKIFGGEQLPEELGPTLARCSDVAKTPAVEAAVVV